MSRRKSKAEHQLTGTYQPSRNTDVVAAEGAPVPLEDVQDVFAFLSTRLDQLGLTGSIDSVGLTLLADQIHMYLLAKKNLGDDIVVTTTGDKGQERRVLNPWYKVMQEAAKETRNLGREYGLTPSGRASLMHMIEGADKGQDAFEAFLAESD